MGGCRRGRRSRAHLAKAAGLAPPRGDLEEWIDGVEARLDEVSSEAERELGTILLHVATAAAHACELDVEAIGAEVEELTMDAERSWRLSRKQLDAQIARARFGDSDAERGVVSLMADLLEAGRAEDA